MGGPRDAALEADLKDLTELSTGCVAAGNKYHHIYLRLRVRLAVRLAGFLRGCAIFNGAETDARPL